MKILFIILYIVGSILLIVSCFINNELATWWTGGIALILLVLGCLFQFFGANKNKKSDYNSLN